MYLIFHGEDEFSRSEALSRLRTNMGDPQFADMNTATFDGRRVTLGELKHACDSIPFLADKRLVIVHGMLALLEPHRKKGEEEGDAEEGVESNPDLAKALKEYLPHIPETTQLVFVETKMLAKSNPVLKQAEGTSGTAEVREFKLPKERDLPRWIEDRIYAKGGRVDPGAAAELSAHVGADLRLLDNELEKLSTYCGDRPIRAEDVRVLVAAVHEANIFQLVDAMGARQTRTALTLLHAKLEQNAAPLYVLAMITRQFRILLQVKDLAARGLKQIDIQERLKLHPFVIDKINKQASNFTLGQLNVTYGKLLETDLAIKTGTDPVLALDTLVVDLTRR